MESDTKRTQSKSLEVVIAQEGQHSASSVSCTETGGKKHFLHTSFSVLDHIDLLYSLLLFTVGRERRSSEGKQMLELKTLQKPNESGLTLSTKDNVFTTPTESTDMRDATWLLRKKKKDSLF